MDDKTRNLVLTIVGAALIIITAGCIPPLVYLEVSKQGSVSTQLAGLLAIPLAAGAAMIRSAFVNVEKEKLLEEQEKKEKEQGDK